MERWEPDSIFVKRDEKTQFFHRNELKKIFVVMFAKTNYFITK